MTDRTAAKYLLIADDGFNQIEQSSEDLSAGTYYSLEDLKRMGGVILS
jgi:hypothetical protein